MKKKYKAKNMSIWVDILFIVIIVLIIGIGMLFRDAF